MEATQSRLKEAAKRLQNDSRANALPLKYEAILGRMDSCEFYYTSEITNALGTMFFYQSHTKLF